MGRLINFFFKNQIDKQANENTLNLTYAKAKAKIDDFIKLTKPINTARRSTFNTFFSFVLDGNQWSDSEIKELDGDMDLTFNFSENYIDRYMARLFPRNPHTGVLEVGVKVYETNDQKQQAQEQAILDTYSRESIVAMLLEQGLNYLCGGGAVFYYPKDPITNKAKIISLDPKVCYVGWKGNQLVQFAYEEFVGDNKYNLYYWDLNEFLFFDAKANKVARQDNTYNFIPVSWIPNNPKPHTHEGRSKINALYNLDREYNFAATDYGRRIKNNTDPHLVIMSDTVSISDIDRGRKKKTKLAKGEDAKYLELQGGDEIVKYLDLIESKIKSKTGIVDSSGSTKSAVSGLSLSFQFSDMMDLIGFMRVFWDKAFRELNQAILSYELGEVDYKTDPVYHPFISLDSKQRVEEYEIMLNSKIISHRDAIDELRGVENPQEKLDEIIAEIDTFAPAPINSNFNSSNE